MARNSNILGVSSLFAVYISAVSALPRSTHHTIDTTCALSQVRTTGSNGVSDCSLPSSNKSDPIPQILERRVVSNVWGAVFKKAAAKAAAKASPQNKGRKAPPSTKTPKSTATQGRSKGPPRGIPNRHKIPVKKGVTKGPTNLNSKGKGAASGKVPKPKPMQTQSRAKGRPPGISKARKTRAKNRPSKGPPKVTKGRTRNIKTKTRPRPGKKLPLPGGKKSMSPSRKVAPKKKKPEDCDALATPSDRATCKFTQKSHHGVALYAVDVGQVDYDSEGDDSY